MPGRVSGSIQSDGLALHIALLGILHGGALLLTAGVSLYAGRVLGIMITLAMALLERPDEPAEQQLYYFFYISCGAMPSALLLAPLQRLALRNSRHCGGHC